MKVLTATNQTQGWRDNDFCWTVEGELVFFSPVGVLLPRWCSSPPLVFFSPIECSRGSIDDGCRCRRSMAGLVSQRATTTIKVTARDELDPDTYFTLISEGLRDQGYVTEELMTNRNVNEWLRDVTDELMCIADAFAVTTVLERRGDFINVRQGTAGP